MNRKQTKGKEYRKGDQNLTSQHENSATFLSAYLGISVIFNMHDNQAYHTDDEPTRESTIQPRCPAFQVLADSRVEAGQSMGQPSLIL